MQKKTMKVLMKTKRKLSKKSTKTKNALVQFNENSSILRTMQQKYLLRSALMFIHGSHRNLKNIKSCIDKDVETKFYSSN